MSLQKKLLTNTFEALLNAATQTLTDEVMNRDGINLMLQGFELIMQAHGFTDVDLSDSVKEKPAVVLGESDQSILVEIRDLLRNMEWVQPGIDAVLESIEVNTTLRGQRQISQQSDEGNRMENQHRKTTGCSDLNEAQIKAINAIKSESNRIGLLIDEMESSSELDQHWVEQAKLMLQAGFMFAELSVTKKTTF